MLPQPTGRAHRHAKGRGRFRVLGRRYRARARAVPPGGTSGMPVITKRNAQLRAVAAPKLRVAAYTRKSIADSPDQEFGSIEAQREACAAYVASMRGEGWHRARRSACAGKGAGSRNAWRPQGRPFGASDPSQQTVASTRGRRSRRPSICWARVTFPLYAPVSPPPAGPDTGAFLRSLPRAESRAADGPVRTASRAWCPRTGCEPRAASPLETSPVARGGGSGALGADPPLKRPSACPRGPGGGWYARQDSNL